MGNRFTVADFFCGGGGFSEGFKLEGFDIIFALDNWAPARLTFKLNNPNTKIIGLTNHLETMGNILSIEVGKIDEIVDDTDVIIGSPPCVSFSSSNRAGNGDKVLGIKLIEKFLQIVAVKKHKPKSRLKYWLMENVPNSRRYVKSEYRFKDLGLNNKILKKLGIKKKEKNIALSIDLSDDNIYNSVYFGVPQRRERFICGEFPKPKKITVKIEEWVTLVKILNALRNKKPHIYDPNFGTRVPNRIISDHYYDTTIPKTRWEEAKIKKTQARYYGKMHFPEDETQPSRTVLATRSVLSRESMIFSNGIPGHCRAPTIREVACLMSFPITYQFQAKNEAIKHRLVGNAVCPKLAASFARAILEKEGKPIIKKYRIYSPNLDELAVNLRKNPPSEKMARDKHSLSNFSEIVPDLKYKNFRVEMDNNYPKTKGGEVEWRASIHHATGKNDMKKAVPKEKEILNILKQFKDPHRMDGFIREVKKTFDNNIPTALSFQEQHCKALHDKRYLTPRQSLIKVKDVVDKFFPDKEFRESYLSNIRDFKTHKKYMIFDRGEPPQNQIPLRILCALYVTCYISKLTRS